ncbi:Outer membrane receptor proteins, mostly Fe transport [Chryseobacterium sp. RU37D]|uniref:TonB-dependent receptor domain-containing protein n=1 Tax=Chryseobacterium sp. RU37D TaxID=1907397 RepID=UPI0009541954|nr:TonB-dependent receptor [Chryseobacterium sp. RU37D]SIQ74862.1 Outer membrane receptor proteins, mostly Fe transport [Chryseobacterium sp. RU37D]
MNFRKLSIAVLFLTTSGTVLYAQETKKDTAKSEKKIEGVIIKGSTKKGTEANLINVQKKSVEVIERVGSVQLAKQGVGDVATAVTKATGTIKQEGSGQIFVRGLGDRYNSTTLNGLPIPSDDPEFKNINLEIFKTSMIEYISLDKVYNPRILGDFGGANVNIVSKEHTGKPYFKIGIGSSINLQTFDNNNFKIQDGAPGFFGFKETTFKKGNPYQNYPFNTKWNFKNADNPFNTDMNIEGGATLGKFSLFAYAGFENSYEYSKGQEGFYFAENTPNKNYTDVERSNYKTNTTALVNLGYKFNANNKISFTSNFIHSSDQSAKIYKGFSYDVDRNVIINRGDNKITSTWVNQLLGTHKFNDTWNADWAVGYNILNSKRPDRMQNTIDATTMQLITGSAINNHRYFDELKDNTVLGHAYLSKTLDKFKITLGYDGQYKDRRFDYTTIGMNFNLSPIVDPDNIDAFINASNNSIFTYQTFQPSTKLFEPFYYTVKQNIQSGLANVDITVSEKFVVQIGGRFDYIDMQMKWLDPIALDGKKNKQYNKFLPALNAKYSLNDKQNLRLSFSKTYTLPQAKELIPIAYYDVTTNTYGNPNLYPSDNYNADLKWELFPKSGELMSVTAFGKYIQNAIARTNYASSAPSDMSYFNISDWGYILGAEVELRKDIYSWSNSKIYTFINGTYMHSQQKFKSESQIAKENRGKTIVFNTDKDDIQGVADFIANANLGYSYKWSNNLNSLDFVVSYSRVGKNLYAVGTTGIGNFYEVARNVLDANLNFSLNKIGIGVSAKNLLNPHYKIEQENTKQTFIHKDYTKGRQIGLSLSYKF